MKWLAKEQIIKLHTQIATETGGLNGLRDESMLDSAVKAPLQTFGGEDLFPSLLSKAVRLGFGIIGNHPFLDGNKRIGTHVMLIILSLNNIALEYEDDELINIILKTAAGEAEEKQLSEWVKTHIA